jgi:hypothetical protein
LFQQVCDSSTLQADVCRHDKACLPLGEAGCGSEPVSSKEPSSAATRARRATEVHPFPFPHCQSRIPLVSPLWSLRAYSEVVFIESRTSLRRNPNVILRRVQSRATKSQLSSLLWRANGQTPSVSPPRQALTEVWCVPLGLQFMHEARKTEVGWNLMSPRWKASRRACMHPTLTPLAAVIPPGMSVAFGHGLHKQ